MCLCKMNGMERNMCDIVKEHNNVIMENNVDILLFRFINYCYLFFSLKKSRTKFSRFYRHPRYLYKYNTVIS